MLASASRIGGSSDYVTGTACGGAPLGVTCSLSNNANTVLVNGLDAAGAFDDTGFYVMVVP